MALGNSVEVGILPAIDAYGVICVYGIYVAFKGHVYCWHIYSNSIANKSCSLFFDSDVQ